MTNIAILGFGVVGSGIAQVIEKNAQAINRMTNDTVNLKYILDKREFPDSPYADRVVHDITQVVNDPEVDVVCECMGGVHPAYEFTMAAFMGGKSVVTSNKELVANCGVDLMNAAKKHGVSYMFEASVGGGIPEIRSMRTSLAMDRINKIDGIMNGTTNYILTRMKKDAVSFEVALKEAQALGYAEANPTADVDGIDAQRKIMILSAIATDGLAYERNVFTQTMRLVSTLDMDAASRFGGTVKLIGSYRNHGDKMALYVCPRFVPASDPLAGIDDVFNGIKISLETTGEIMYYGRGAGSLPTASAMVSDVVSVMTGAAKTELRMKWHPAEEDAIVPFETLEFAYYVRLKTSDLASSEKAVKDAFGEVTVMNGTPDGYYEFITPVIVEKDMKSVLASCSLGDVDSVIRVMD